LLLGKSGLEFQALKQSVPGFEIFIAWEWKEILPKDTDLAK